MPARTKRSRRRIASSVALLSTTVFANMPPPEPGKAPKPPTLNQPNRPITPPPPDPGPPINVNRQPRPPVVVPDAGAPPTRFINRMPASEPEPEPAPVPQKPEKKK